MRHDRREKLSSGCIKKCRTEAEVEEATGRETTTTIETIIIIINAIRVVIDHHHHHGCVLFVVCDFYVLLSLLLSVVFQRERERERERSNSSSNCLSCVFVLFVVVCIAALARRADPRDECVLRFANDTKIIRMARETALRQALRRG